MQLECENEKECNSHLFTFQMTSYLVDSDEIT